MASKQDTARITALCERMRDRLLFGSWTAAIEDLRHIRDYALKRREAEGHDQLQEAALVEADEILGKAVSDAPQE